MNLPLEAQIESILFWKGEPVAIREIARLLKASEDDVRAGLEALRATLTSRGLQLVTNGDDATLSTHAEMHGLIEELTKAELTRDLSRAALETLSIIVYRGPLTRSEVDYIRGVNSQFIIRTLLVRGLVSKVDNPKDERSFLYKPSIELLQFLGVGRAEDMPDYDKVRADVEAFITKQNEDGAGTDGE